MKKVFLILGIIFGVAVILTIIGAIVVANVSKSYDDSNFTETVIVEEAEVISLKIEIARDNLILLPSEDGRLKIVYFANDKIQHSYSFSDGYAKFCQKAKGLWFSFLHVRSHTVTVYVPESLNDKLELTLASGHIQNTCEELTVNSLSIDVASGNVDFGKTKVNGKCDVDVASGIVNLYDITAEKISLDISSGDLTIENVVADSVTLDIASGKVNLSGLTVDSLEAELASGSLTAVSSDIKRIKADMSSGTLKISLTGKLDDYRVKGSATSGSITVNRSNVVETSGKKINFGSGENTVEIELTSGNATISFEE